MRNQLSCRSTRLMANSAFDTNSQLTGLSLGALMLVMTANIALWSGRTSVAETYAGALWGHGQFTVIFVILAGVSLFCSWRLFKAPQRIRSWLHLGVAIGLFAIVIGWRFDAGTGSFSVVASSVAFGLAAVLIVLPDRNRHRLLEWEQRALLVVLGMLILDLGFDLPNFIGTDDGLCLSYLNNTIHNHTLVHDLWLPVCMLTIGISIIIGVIRDRHLEDLVKLFLLILGAVFLYVLVEPSELELQNVLVDDPAALPLLRIIGLSHIGSVFTVLIALVLARRKVKRLESIASSAENGLALE